MSTLKPLSKTYKKTTLASIIVLSAFTGLAACSKPAQDQAGSNTAEATTEAATAQVDTTNKATTNTATAEAAATDGTQTQAVLAGTYTGVLPCASCSGIDTKIVFTEDGSIERTLQFQEEGEEPRTETGTYEIKDGVIHATIGDEVFKYQILDENKIAMLDTEGEPVTGELAKFYELTKQ